MRPRYNVLSPTPLYPLNTPGGMKKPFRSTLCWKISTSCATRDVSTEVGGGGAFAFAFPFPFASLSNGEKALFIVLSKPFEMEPNGPELWGS